MSHVNISAARQRPTWFFLPNQPFIYLFNNLFKVDNLQKYSIHIYIKIAR